MKFNTEDIFKPLDRIKENPPGDSRLRCRGFESPLRRLFFMLETLTWHCCMCFKPANGRVEI